MSDQLIAIVAAWRDDLRRALAAVEALTVQGESLAKALKDGMAAAAVIPLGGLVEIDRSTRRAPAAMAAALVGFLERGGRLDPELARDLAGALSRSSLKT